MADAISTYPDHNGPIARLSQISRHLANCSSPSITNFDSGNLPSPSASPQESKDIAPPSMILLFSWGGATTSAISRYVARYSILYPSAPVIIFTSPFTYLMPWPISAQWQRELGLDNLLQTLSSSSNDNNILVHTFSNGGSYRFANIVTGYYSVTRTSLPIRALVFDSAPTVSGIWTKTTTLTNALSRNRLVRLILLVVTLVVTSTTAAWSAVTWQHEPTTWTRQVLNDATYMRPTAPRVYIYSKEDQVVNDMDVEEHAEAARKRGYSVNLERFHGSQHVSHAKLDPNRYWSIISRLWDTAGEVQGNSTANRGDAVKIKLE